MADDESGRATSRVFTVRLWVGGTARRGTVRDVASGAFRNFREWSDLTSFLSERTEEEAP